jgi:hypothetical protein
MFVLNDVATAIWNMADKAISADVLLEKLSSTMACVYSPEEMQVLNLFISSLMEKHLFLEGG